MRYAIIAGLALSLVAVHAQAAKVYKWTEDGQVQYGSQPPVGVGAQEMDLRSNEPREPEVTAETDQPERDETASGEPEANEETAAADDSEQLRQSCEAARENVEVLRAGGTNRRFRNPEGEVVRYSEEELAERIETNERFVEEYCEGL